VILNTKFIYRSATELAELIRNREVTSLEVVQEHLAQIKKYNPLLNAVVILLEEEALRAAEACDREASQGRFRGDLHGVPMTVKEQFWVKGTRSTLNFNRLKDWRAPEDAVIVERLRRAGAVILGKTNIAKNLLDYQVRGDIYPEGKNPYNTEYSPGGSSGGSAAALASGMVPVELGGDFGGSIRIPSNFCGIYGLKPTENTIPGHGHVPRPKDARSFIFHMAVSGPMARTPHDLELVWKNIRGEHKSDRSVPRIEWHNPDKKRLQDYKIAWVDGWPGYETSVQTKNVIQDFIRMLDEKGCITTHEPPGNNLHERTLDLYRRLSFQLILQDVPMLVKPLMMMDIKRTFLKGVSNVVWKFRDSLLGYSELMGIRAALVREWEEYLGQYDLLVCPIGFGPAYKRCKIGTPISYDGKELLYLNYVWPYNACFNGSGHPSIAIPLGLGKEGLPIGLQVVGSYWSEPDLIHFAKLVSAFTPGFVKPHVDSSSTG
jgi:amidase